MARDCGSSEESSRLARVRTIRDNQVSDLSFCWPDDDFGQTMERKRERPSHYHLTK